MSKTPAVSHPNPQKAGIHPPYKGKEQDAPGSEAVMEPKPDHGEESYKGLGRLKGKVALVTGGDSGIGKAVCIAYAREGADVVIAYLNEHKDAEDTKQWIERAGQKGHIVAADLSTEAGCNKIVTEAVKAFGRIDILVNNAATQRKFSDEGIQKFEYDMVLHTFKVNIVAMFAVTKAALDHMKEGSCIINVGSIEAYAPDWQILDYAATKGAITTFTKGLCKQLIDKGIRVNQVAPGPVWTPLIQVSFPAEKQTSFGTQYTPMKRAAQPVELAGSFVFLASNESHYVNGEILGVTGGMLLG